MLELDYKNKLEGYYDGLRKDILPLLPRNVEKVLDVGCGKGATLAYLKEHNYCDIALGVELFPEAAEVAIGKVDKLYEVNIETADLPIGNESVDVILCLDLLEHLINPEAVIEKLHKYLKPGGVLIASLPNVRHVSVILPLLFLDKWSYADRGILDKTHLRFFVRGTAILLLESSGLTVDQVVAREGRKGKFISLVTFGLFQSFYTSQYLLRAKK
jgi:SAM-dependent methyltransferase